MRSIQKPARAKPAQRPARFALFLAVACVAFPAFPRFLFAQDAISAPAPTAGAAESSTAVSQPPNHAARDEGSTTPMRNASSSETAVEWREKYVEAIRVNSFNFEKSITMFRDVADHAEPILANKALLQISVVYRLGMMEPRLALGILDEFLARSTAPDHPGYERAKSAQLVLKDVLGEIDALEGHLAAAPACGDDPATATLMTIGNLYLKGLDAPNYGFRSYKRAFEASSKTLDMAYYMMGYCKMDLAEYSEAAGIFQDFRKRFPNSPSYSSAFELAYRCKYLLVHSIQSPARQARAAADLIAELDRALAENPNLDPEVRERLKTLRRLSHKYLAPKQEPEQEPPLPPSF